MEAGAGKLGNTEWGLIAGGGLCFRQEPAMSGWEVFTGTRSGRCKCGSCLLLRAGGEALKGSGGSMASCPPCTAAAGGLALLTLEKGRQKGYMSMVFKYRWLREKFKGEIRTFRLKLQ